MADVRADAWPAIQPTVDANRVLFKVCDVSSWDDNAALFKAAYEWEGQGSHRIDYFAANAGIAATESLLEHGDLNAEPQKPDLRCIDVDFLGPVYGLKLYIHYARKTSRELGPVAAAPAFNPKITITSSPAGHYAFPVDPQYGASKHALVGLTRSVGETLLNNDNIAVNCIMPGLVRTNIIPKWFYKVWPTQHFVPMSQVMRAHDELMEEAGKVAADGKSDGQDGVVKTAQVVEISVDRLFYRDPVELPDDTYRFMVGELKPGGLWWPK